MFDIEDYNYDLPPALIAQAPASRRDHSRLLVVDRSGKSFSDRNFFDLPVLLRPGDLLVVNDTKVVPARLFGRKETGGLCEILVLEHPGPTREAGTTRSCMFRSSRPARRGSRLLFESGVSGRIEDVLDHGLVKISFSGAQSIDALLEEKGYMPLPPYIKRPKKGKSSPIDRDRYQTVFSKNRGAVAAPTAGLHFTGDLIEKLRQAEIYIVSLTLHVGYGTFRPVRTEDVRKHNLGEEFYRIGPETAEAIRQTRQKGGRTIAVGTTVVRALETAAGPDGFVVEGQGKTDLLVTPGHSFNVVDALVTNFHLPKSSLLFLVSAFAGLALVKRAYGRAIEKGYRFYSYGDAMLII
ncbi:MAG: tRNA preQ1(34) S-adenosylmethionine ribosyltransferase-isomerase QueA [Thermodesulfobacteriota bacterium]|nr:tRNA preQ1(34) S-adenosylmethionine ribosyltransferase-isomerase QueA [Thermodesulfobacteriota bacterium]